MNAMPKILCICKYPKIQKEKKKKNPKSKTLLDPSILHKGFLAHISKQRGKRIK
jgi:hypothetical protein